MKSPEQVTLKLEKVVDDLSKVIKTLPTQVDNATFEEKVALSSNIGMMCALAWVLDYEEELKEVFALTKVASITQQLKEKFSEN